MWKRSSPQLNYSEPRLRHIWRAISFVIIIIKGQLYIVKEFILRLRQAAAKGPRLYCRRAVYRILPMLDTNHHLLT